MIIEIQDSRATARIDSLGGQLISYKDASGQEYIWQRDPGYWANCSPTLFPIVGGLREGKTEIQGNTFEMPKHGFVKTSQLAPRKEGPDQASFTLTDSPETRSMYPFPFCLTIRYRLEDGALHMEQTVSNTGEEELPYFIGTHPGFICPLLPGERFEDYVLEFDQKETRGYRPFDEKQQEFMAECRPFPGDGQKIPLNYPLFSEDAIWFDAPISRKVRLYHPVTGRGMEVSFPDFSSVAFWTPGEKQAPFLCIEPWNGSGPCAGEGSAFLEKNHLQTLAPGQSKTYQLIMKYL